MCCWVNTSPPPHHHRRHHKHHRLRTFAATPDDLPLEVRADLDPDKKRKNPKARKRAMKKRAQEAMGIAATAPQSQAAQLSADGREKKRKKKRF